ncbi:MAG: FAD-dependent oxidoreductase [Nitrospira sp.]|nr:FAD-dependent oxidoreductase [Nitrospira sp.]
MPPVAGQIDIVRTGVLVVGAGIAGIACARALARSGVDDVIVLELEGAAGGNSRGHRLGGSGCPLGAHYLPLPGPQAHEVSELLFDLGLLRSVAGRTVAYERHLCHSPQERLFFDGAWHDGLLPPAAPGSRTLAQYRAFAARVAEVQRLGFALPTQRAPWTAAHAALDGETFAQWLARERFDDPQLRWSLDYACRDDYGAGVAEVSAWAGLHYFASRHGFAAPGDDSAEPVFTWSEGNAWLAERLAAPLRERLRAAHTVLQVDEQRHGVQVLAFDHGRGEAVAFDAHAVVLALPLFVAQRVLRSAPAPLQSALQAAAARARYAPWLVANLLLRAPLLERASGAVLSWDNVGFGSPSLGYVSAQHQSLRPDQQATVLTAYWALPQAERATLLADDWRPWAQRVIDDLATLHPDLPHQLERIDLMRYGHAMRIPTPGARGDPALAALVAQAGRVQFAHADLSAYSVFEEAYTHGVQAATRVQQVLSQRPPAARPLLSPPLATRSPASTSPASPPLTPRR